MYDWPSNLVTDNLAGPLCFSNRCTFPNHIFMVPGTVIGTSFRLIAKQCQWTRLGASVLPKKSSGVQSDAGTSVLSASWPSSSDSEMFTSVSISRHTPTVTAWSREQKNIADSVLRPVSKTTPY
ncbi:hypothetical protein VOLCADRAFT_106294 [Volvox carteri f. nagariensis]|uniref:Uncharacterized protein n=1 Tax=Volvox carteri f. nagariensis TaxID=3068 RepID=D8U6E8_VOLCA|nr:uncharacterized protein VOLCADRAFT_106294 [Volvox carteri f. nagariensis]EFJ44631.1 hypothetical protein VOLCADRAFT_106294 [Volvox carteri f. nagariensis]|eukprot:XP_002954207.1 hypothetical protein VOLCADRAFT_106294 [Volvox carteri f. nagariensis]